MQTIRIIPRTTWIPFVAILLATLGCAGCAPESETSSDWNVGDAGTDTGGPTEDTWTEDGSGEPDGGAREPLSTTFRLVNEGDYRVEITPFDPCTSDSGSWVSLSQNGTSIDPRDSCGVCNCDELREGRCTVCGAPACEPGGSTRPIEPGEMAEWTWQGRHYREGSVEGQTCERPVIPERGEAFRAEICWQLPPAVDDGSENCQPVEFEYGREEVVHRISPTVDPEPQPTEFRIVNEAGTELFLQPPATAVCSARDNWISLRDGNAEVDLDTDCTICSCDDARSGDCRGACDLGCTGPRILSAGETRTYQWDGVGYRTNSTFERACHEEWRPQVGREFDARFCWFTSHEGAFVNCDTVSFEYGEESVVEKVVGESEDAKPTETTFTIQNESAQTIQVELRQQCPTDSPNWLDVKRGGSEVNTGIQCDECACQELRDTGDCSRACPAVSCVGGERDLGTGEEHSWSWPGYVAESSNVNGQQCLEQTVPPSGDAFVAEFCWTTGFGASETEKCEDVQFQYDRDEKVVHEVQ